MGQYCISCGTELPTEAEFCGKCGTEVESGQDHQKDGGEQEVKANSGETGICQKCGTEIPKTADRCPQCGYESSLGIGGSILFLITLPIFLFCALIAIISPLLVFSGLSPTDAVLSLSLFGGVAAFTGWGMYKIYLIQEAGPTDR